LHGALAELKARVDQRLVDGFTAIALLAQPCNLCRESASFSVRAAWWDAWIQFHFRLTRFDSFLKQFRHPVMLKSGNISAPTGMHDESILNAWWSAEIGGLPPDSQALCAHSGGGS
jgi:hypothetical protein